MRAESVDAGPGADALRSALQALRAFGLGYPGAHTRSPWPCHLDLAEHDKAFAYLSIEGEALHISCKLPQSGQDALWLPFAKPTAYGRGRRRGWQTGRLIRPACAGSSCSSRG